MKHFQKMIRNNLYLTGLVWKNNKVYLLVYALHIFLSYCRDILLVVAPKYIFDSMQAGRTVSDILVSVFAYVALYFLFHLLILLLAHCKSLWENRLRKELLSSLGEKFMHLDYLFLEQNQSIDMFQKARMAIEGGLDDIQTMGMAGEQGITGFFEQQGNVIRDLLVIASVCYIFTSAKWYLFCLVCLCTAVSLAASVGKIRSAVGIRKEAGSYLTKSRYCNGLLRRFEYGKEFRVFEMSDFVIDKFDECTREYLDVRGRFRNQSCLFEVLSSVSGGVLRAGVLFYLVWEFQRGALSVGDFSMIFAAVVSFSENAGNLLSSLISMNVFSEYMTDYRRCMEMEECGGDEGAKELTKGRHEIEFRDVWFRYPNASQDAIRGLNVKIDDLQKLSIVGFNGAGKTTFIKLLLGLYQPQRGEILIDGVRLRDYSRKSLLAYMSAFFQDFRIFAMRIDENVALQRDIDRERLWTSMKKSGISEKVESLEKREESVIGGFFERGDLMLSGGESQKIAMARSFYRDTDVVVMDEPTSALDVISEDKMYRSVSENIQDKLLLLISHRLASTKFCDRILVFRDGGIAECGTHEELLEKGGVYAEMWKVQAEKFRWEAAENEI